MKTNMMGKARLMLWGGLAYGALCLSCWGQYSIDWYAIAGGGGSGTGGVYAASFTVGQPVAGGPFTAGTNSLTLTAGFWALQTLGAPPLYISRAGSTVTVYWQNVYGWALQQNTNLVSSNWIPGDVGTNAYGTNFVIIAAPTGSRYFRLQRQ